MNEVKARGERAIQADVLARKHGLNERRMAVVRFLLEHGKMTIRDFEGLCPEANRRSLQRDLKAVVEKGIAASSGATNRLEYHLA